jgi:hypothetical protein
MTPRHPEKAPGTGIAAHQRLQVIAATRCEVGHKTATKRPQADRVHGTVRAGGAK